MKGCGQLGGLMNRLANIPLGVRVLAALLLGVCAGILLPRSGAQDWSDLIVSAAHIAGQLWLSALQMTVIPLIFSLLTIGLTASSRMIGDGGSVARRALLVFGCGWHNCKRQHGSCSDGRRGPISATRNFGPAWSSEMNRRSPICECQHSTRTVH
jgi:hypothetical protein